MAPPGQGPACTACGPRSTTTSTAAAHTSTHIHVDLVGPLPASWGVTHLFTIVERTSRWPEANPIAATTIVDCAKLCFRDGWVDATRRPGGNHIRLRSPFNLLPCGSPWATCSKSSTPRQQPTMSSGFVERFHRCLKDVLRAVAPWPTGQITCRGCWASTQQPEKMTTPHQLSQFSAHHTFYLANF